METLVLSPGYEPIGKITWQRAVTLLFDGKVEVVDEYEDKLIRSVTFEIRMPAVIRFFRAIKGKKRAIKFSRENVYLRDRGTCQYCRVKVPRTDFTYDHVIPKAQGGQTTWENVVVSCTPCNQTKAGRTPEQAKMPLLNKPAKPGKLPEAIRMTFMWQKGMPDAWKQWLASVSYWHTELENDNE